MACGQAKGASGRMPEEINWEAILADYLTGQMSIREIADKHGVNYQKIYRRASKEGWKQTAQRVRDRTETKIVDRLACARAKELSDMTEAAERMGRLLNETVFALTMDDIAEVKKNLKGMNALAGAINTNASTLAQLYGLQTPAQVHAQRIADEKLKLEKRRLKLEEDKHRQDGAGQEIHVTIHAPEGMEGLKLDE